MRICIVSYNFYPIINPRAFRTNELVKGFCDNGHKITLFIPDNGQDLSSFTEGYNNLEIVRVKPGFYLNRGYTDNNAFIDANEENGKLYDFVQEQDKEEHTHAPKDSLVKRIKFKVIKLLYHDL